MSSAPQDTAESSDFLAFDGNKNNDDNKNFRNNFQYRPYNNRNRYHRNQNFRQNHWNGRNDGDSQFTPANFSSPVGGHHQQRNDGFHNRQHHRNQYQRNFVPFKKFGGNNHRNGGNQNVPIEQYVHQSMLEDPWVNCDKFKYKGVEQPEIESPTTSTEQSTECISTEQSTECTSNMQASP